MRKIPLHHLQTAVQLELKNNTHTHDSFETKKHMIKKQ